MVPVLRDAHVARRIMLPGAHIARSDWPLQTMAPTVYIVVADIVMAYTVMAAADDGADRPYSYGRHSYGLHGYGRCR